VQMLSSLSLLAHKLFWIRLDWIVLHTNENTESMVKERINPSALPNSRQINSTSVIMWQTGKMCLRQSILSKI